MPSMLLWVLGPLLLSLLLQRPELIAVAVVLVVVQRAVPDPLLWLRSGAQRRQLGLLLAQNPHNAVAARQLAMLHLDAHAPKPAIGVLELAKQRDPSAETLFLLGLAHLRAGAPDKGLPELDAAIALDERIRYGDAHLARGTALWKLEKKEEAAASFRRFVSINGSSLEGHLRLAQAESALGHEDAAKAARAEAKSTWAALPGFQKKKQRWWWLRMLTGL